MEEIGVFRRLGVSTRAAMAGVLAGLAGTGALGASLLLDWQRVTLSSVDARGGDARPLTFGLAAMPYAEVYLLGVLGLLAMLGTAVARPDRARWLRFSAAGLGAGLATLVLLMIFSAKSTILSVYLGEESLRASMRILAGGYWGLGAVAAPVVGVWLTVGGPAAVAAAPPVEQAVPTPIPEPPTGRLGYLDGLTVTSSEPIDVGAGTDVLRT